MNCNLLQCRTIQVARSFFSGLLYTVLGIQLRGHRVWIGVISYIAIF